MWFKRFSRIALRGSKFFKWQCLANAFLIWELLRDVFYIWSQFVRIVRHVMYYHFNSPKSLWKDVKTIQFGHHPFSYKHGLLRQFVRSLRILNGLWFSIIWLHVWIPFSSASFGLLRYGQKVEIPWRLVTLSLESHMWDS